jgi:hypothetical protein
MEVVKKDIRLKDVAKVMREVGYNKTSVAGKGGSNMEDQLAKANENAKSAPTMADAINRAVTAVAPPVEAPIKVPIKIEPKGSKSKAVEKLKEKHKEPVKEEEPKGPKKVTIDMTTLGTKVTFVGRGWKPLDIKIANTELIKAFRIKIRDEYRKGIK